MSKKSKNKPAPGTQQIQPNRWVFMFAIAIQNAAGGISFSNVPIECTSPQMGMGELQSVITKISETFTSPGGIVGQRPQITIMCPPWLVAMRYEPPVAPAPVAAPESRQTALAAVPAPAESRQIVGESVATEGAAAVDHDSDDEA